jgi:membrane-associated phospholipid phosphatase
LITSPHITRTSAAPSFRTFLRTLAVQDVIVLAYLVALLLASLAGTGPRRAAAIVGVLGDIVALSLGLVLGRGGRAPPRLAAVAYRVGLFSAVFGSFSQLQLILPTARTTQVDAPLYAFDKAVFGFEPAEALDRFVTSATTEWFSFFYFGYFFLLAVHVFPALVAARNMRRLSELSFGILALFCIGQLLYILVPGYGPYHHLAGSFTHELQGPVWWRLVRATVDAGEVTSRTDIFPSLHTAAPTYLALFALRHRRASPYRYVWLPLCFFASQIVVSTMFLRWHYLVDVIAGLALAAAVHAVAARVVRWETRRRAALGIAPVWEGLRQRSMRTTLTACFFHRSSNATGSMQAAMISSDSTMRGPGRLKKALPSAT